MTNQVPLFSTSLMGSLPRPKEIINGLRKIGNQSLTRQEFNQWVEQETQKGIALQEKWGLDIITSGEYGRDNYVSFIADQISGVSMMNMGQLLDYIEDKKAFEQILTTLDVPASSIKNAICTGKIAYQDKGIAVPELKLIKKYTKKPVKITLPGPYLLTRSMWLPALSQSAYASKEELGQAVIALLKQEIDQLQDIGVDIIQFDEPVLTEVVFTEGKPRSFMCAALSERKDPTEELTFAASLISPVLAHVDPNRSQASLHICRGNWSKDESILLKGPYTPLLNLFADVKAYSLALEFSTPRAGDLSALLSDPRFGSSTKLALGVLNPRSDDVESIESIMIRVEEAMKIIPKEHISLVPDCGFATFANRPVNVLSIIEKKVHSMVESAKQLRQKYGD